MQSKEYLNRNTATSSADKGAYKLSVIATKGIYEITSELTNKVIKDELTTLLKNETFSNTIKVNERINLETLCKCNILCPSVFKKDATSREDTEVEYSKFVFIDIDNGLSIQEVQKILDEKELSYFLYTSVSHKKEHHKFHIFVPTLKEITTKEKYKAYWQYLHELFESKTDTSCSSWSKAAYVSLKDGIVINNMYRNDLYLTAEELNVYTKIAISYENAKHLPSGIAHSDYLKMIKNSNPNLVLVASTDKVTRYKRNDEDSIGNLFNYHSKDEKCIIDTTKGNSTDLLFSNSDFLYSIKPEDKIEINTDDLVYLKEIVLNPKFKDIYTDEQRKEIKERIYEEKTERENIQRKINELIDNHILTFYDIGLSYKKSIIVANEGVGKSLSIIKLCKETNIIYAADTKVRINEIKESLDKEGIANIICYSNSEILEEFDLSKEFINYFEEAMKQNVSTYDFIDSNLVSDVAKKVKEAIFVNNKKIERKDLTVLLTTKKLKILLQKQRKNNNLSIIVFDEFEVSDFYSYIDEKVNMDIKKVLQINNLYGNEMLLSKNNYNLFDLLIGKSAIILSTELEKVKRVFHKRDNYYIYDETTIIKAENITYILTSSTSNVGNENGLTKRDEQIQKVKELHPEVSKVISNNSSEADLSHKAVRGSNSFKQETTLVVGHYPSATEQYLFYEAAKEYYNDTFGDDLDSIADDINYTIMGTQISQSIGRNSGFRESGAKCYVLLPILAPNSTKCFKKRDKQKMELHLKYVSPNIERLIA